MKRLFRLSLGRRGIDRDVSSEIAFHIDMRTRELVAGGIPPERARAEAEAAFGQVASIADACRNEQRRHRRNVAWVERFDDALRDLKYAARTLVRAPAFTLTALTTLALGIGANSAIFSLVNGVLLRRLPYGNANHLVVVQHPSKKYAGSDVGFSPIEVADIRAQLPMLRMAEYHSMSFDIIGHGDPRRVQTGVVSADFFGILGVTPLLGRTFVAGEDAEGAPPVLVLSYKFWHDELNADSSIVGQTFKMNDRQHLVVGVLPPLPPYPDKNDVWMPTSSCPFRSADVEKTERAARMLGLVVQMPDTMTPQQGQHAFEAVERRMAAEYPKLYRDVEVRVSAIHSQMTDAARPAFLVLLGIAGLVLLVACINVAHLTLARQLGRQREMAVRAALGAAKSRLVRQLLVESLLLSFTGGLLGLAVARASVAPLAAFASKVTARSDAIVLDWHVTLFTLGIAIVAGVVFAVAPALVDRADVISRLRDGSATAGTTRVRLRGALVVGEVALAFVVLVGAGLTLKSFARMMATAPGYDPQDVVTARIDLNFTKFGTPAAVRQFTHDVTDKLAAKPGVVSVGVANAFPSSSAQPQNLRTFAIQGVASPDSASRPRAELNVVSPSYFRAVGVPLLGGRMFDATDRDSIHTVVVSRSLARRYFPNASAVGKRISLGGAWLTVVGVVGDVRQFGPAADSPEQIYVSTDAAAYRDLRVLVRERDAGVRAAQLIRQVVHEIDPNQPVVEVETLEHARREIIATPRQTAALLSVFAALALTIAAAGLGGVIAYSAGQRTAEFGIRMALGAERTSIFRLVVGQGVKLVVAGIAAGVALSLLLATSLSKLIYGVSASDPATYAIVAAVFGVVAMAACVLPARRATTIDPVSAFRAG